LTRPTTAETRRQFHKYVCTYKTGDTGCGTQSNSPLHQCTCSDWGCGTLSWEDPSGSPSSYAAANSQRPM